MTKHPWWLVVAVLSISLAACGGDDDGGKKSPDSGSPGTVAGNDGGTDSGAPMAGSGGSGAAGSSAVTSVPCGSMTCTDPLGGMTLPIPIPIPMMTPCCFDEANSVCGVDMAGTCTEPPPPPTPDPSCPGLNVLGMMISGCCIDGQCGTDASALGMGCSENGAARAALMASGLGGFIMIPDPQACGGASDDGGTEDGGT